MEMQLEQAAKDMAAAVDALLAMPETTGDGAGVVGFCVGAGWPCSWPRASLRSRPWSATTAFPGRA